MTKKDAYHLGYDAGRNAAQYTECQASDRHEARCGCTGVSECEECLTVAADESENNARQYTPFEIYAQEINASRHAESQWDAYDKGVADGIRQGITERLEKGARS